MALRAASLKYEYRQYTVYAQRIGAGIPESETRKEYTRLRDILNKRIKRIQDSDFANQGIAGKFPGGLPKLADIAPEDLPYLLQQAATALNSNSGSLKGLQQRRRSAIESFRERGYTQINESNFTEFVKFIEEARERGLDRIYGSDYIVSMYEDVQAIGINPADVMNDFNWWAANIEKAETARDKLKKKGENITAELLRNEMRRMK